MKGVRLQQKLLVTLALLFSWGVSCRNAVTQGRPLSTNAERRPHLRVMTWNAYFVNKDSAAFFATVAATQPDLIAIQELGPSLAAAIPITLSATYPFQLLYPSKIPSGLGVLSRYPLLAITPPDLDPNTGCSCLVATLDLAGQPVTLINTHPWPAKMALTGGKLFQFNTENQDRIFDQILDHIDRVSTPLLVMGDLNTMPIQANYRRLSARLVDAYVASGRGPANTFPVSRDAQRWLPQPLIRIDYIFHDTTWQSQETWVGAIAGSDHRYVMADLVLNQ